jgi:pSer/pThr/pTyr-binding forkhead associated (FHA) protein
MSRSRSSGNEQEAFRGTLEKQLDLVVAQPGPKAGKACLMLSTGEAAGTVFPLTQPLVVIGRAADAQVRINEHAISSEHALLEMDGTTFTLRDLGSTNGTYVNGERIALAVVLASGDTIRMGSTTFTFVTREFGFPQGTIDLHGSSSELSIEPRRSRPPKASRRVVPMPAAGEYTASMSLTDVVSQVRRYWGYVRRSGWIVAVGTSLGVAAGLADAWLRPPPGSAWFEMALAAGARGDDDNTEFFVGAENAFRSIPLIKKSLSGLGTPGVSDALASFVQTQLSFKRVGFNSKVYRGEYEDRTAEKAVAFLNQHVRVYIDSELDKTLKVLRADAEFDREQERQADQRVVEARGRLVEFSDQHPEAVPKDAKLPDGPATRLAPAGNTERSRQNIASTERALRAAYTRIQTRKASPYLEQAAAAETKIAEARARGLGDQHPEVKSSLELQATMREKASRLLAAEPSPGDQSLDPEVARLQQELATLRSRLTGSAASPSPAPARPRAAAPSARERSKSPASPGASQSASGAVPLSQSQLRIQYGELSREYERAKTEHEVLIKKRETTDRLLDRERISAEARYDIMTPPTLAKRPLATVMGKRAGLGGGVGLLLALMVAAYLELRRILIARGHI